MKLSITSCPQLQPSESSEQLPERKCSGLKQNLMQIHCSTHSVILNAVATQQHLLPPQTSTVKSSLFLHAHSSPLSVAARLHQCMQTIPILTMVGLFPDRPCMSFLPLYKKISTTPFPFLFGFFHSLLYSPLMAPQTAPHHQGIHINLVVSFQVLLPQFFNYKDFLQLFLERGEGREKQGEKHQCERETSISCLSREPQTRTEPAIP